MPPCVSRAADADEAYPLAEREYGRAAVANSPVLAAHVLERIPRLFVDVSDTLRPTPNADFVQGVRAWPTVGGRVVYSRSLLGRIHALAAVGDTTDVMDRKAEALIELARLDERRLTAYAAAPEEAGTPPPKSLVRRTALAALVRSNLFVNRPDAREYLEASFEAPRDDVEAAILAPVAGLSLLRRWNPTTHSQDAPRRRASLVRGIADARRRLATAGNARSLDLVIDRLFVVADVAEEQGVVTEARALASDILAANAAFPLTRAGADGERAFALTAAAAAALYDLDHPKVRGGRAHRLYYGTDETLDSRRRGLLEGVPAARLADSTAAARRVDVEAELAAAKLSSSRCYLLGELAYATSVADAEYRFSELLGPVFSGPHVDLSHRNESLCRARAALAMDDVPRSTRIASLQRMLRDRKATAKAECGPTQPIPGREEHDRFDVFLDLVAAHPAWVGESAELRGWLFENGASEGVLRSSAWYGAEGALAYERALAASARPGAPDAAAAARLLRDWMALDSVSFHSASFALERIVVLVGRYAAPFGLRAEAARWLADYRPLGTAGTVYVDHSLDRSVAAAKAVLAIPAPR